MCRRSYTKLETDNKVSIPPSVFSAEMSAAIDNNSYSDVSFSIMSTNETVHSHKCILKARCSYFERLFESMCCLFYSILFYSILCYTILCYSILCYSILFYSILFYSILSTLSHTLSLQVTSKNAIFLHFLLMTSALRNQFSFLFFPISILVMSL